MKRNILLVSLLIALFFVHPVQAQTTGAASPEAYSEFNPVMGGWSEYQVQMKGKPFSRMRISIVGQEFDAYWLETIMEQPDGNVITKVLVSGNPQDPRNLRRTIVKKGAQRAMEIPANLLGLPAQSSVEKGEMVDKGVETVKVPAGSFQAQHFQVKGGQIPVEVWVSKDVTPYGLVKSKSYDMDMVLVKFGTGAKTLITETPEQLDPSLLQPPPGQADNPKRTPEGSEASPHLDPGGVRPLAPPAAA
jgi:hypothetical protein